MSNQVNNDKTKQWYDNNSVDYTQHVRNTQESVYHHYYEKPAMYALLPDDMSGLKVLSLGCGSGEDCAELHKRGAEVTGLDISSGLIKQATMQYPGCQYIVGNMEDLSILTKGQFDLVYSSLAVHYLKDWSLMMSEVARVLKSNGVFQFSMGHPVRMGMIYDDEVTEGRFKGMGGRFKGIGRVKNKKTDKIMVLGDYFAQGPTPALGTKDGPVCYGKTLSKVVALIKEHGFILDESIDPIPQIAMKKLSRNDYEVLSKIPEFIIYKLIKNLG